MYFNRRHFKDTFKTSKYHAMNYAMNNCINYNIYIV